MRRSVQLPTDEHVVRRLHAGDEVLVTGRIVLAREAAHRRLLRHEDPRLRKLCHGALVYHCSPVVDRDARTGRWIVVAAGPSASIHEEPYTARLLERYGLRGAIGRGGMGASTLAALRAHGAVYLHALPDLALSLARHVTSVDPPLLADVLGMDDAVWSLEVRAFPAVVTMDAHGVSLHAPGTAATATRRTPGTLAP